MKMTLRAFRDCLTLGPILAIGFGLFLASGISAQTNYPQSALAWQQLGYTNDGYYTINPGGVGLVSAYCLMSISGGGWTELTSDIANSLLNTNPATSREYLYVQTDTRLWYRSPVTKLVWSWSSGKDLYGTYYYSSGSSVKSFAVTPSGEHEAYGVGGSSGPDNTPKCLVIYSTCLDPNTAQVDLCQDTPGIFGSTCQCGVTTYFRETVLAPPIILSQPTNQTVIAGAMASFQVTATGTAPLAYQWQFDGTALEGATNSTLTLTDVQTNQGGLYNVIVTNVVGSAISSNAVLTVNVPTCDPPPSGMVAWWPGNGNANDIIGGNNGTLTADVTYGPGEVGQAFEFNSDSAMVLLSNSPSLQSQNFTIEAWVRRGSTTAVSSDPTADLAAVLYGYGSNGYAFVLDNDGFLDFFSGNGLGFASSAELSDTNWHHVAVTSAETVVVYCDGVAFPYAGHFGYQFTTSPAIGGHADHLNVAGNDSFLGAINQLSIYNRALSAAEIQGIYNAGVSGKCITSVTIFPTITQQPASIRTNEGTGVVFIVGALGTAPLSYQWQFDGNNLLNATNDVLTLTNVQPANEGSYSVVVTNAAGAVISSNAILSLTDACFPPPAGMVSWWPADGYALDVVGTNNATLENGATYAEGEAGQAFYLNGSNSYVYLPNNLFPFPFSGTGTEPFTMELWFRTTSGGVVFGQDASPVGASISSWDPGIYVGTDGKLRAEVFWSGSVAPMASSSTVNDGVFHHTAVTYDGTNEVLFLDGKSIQTNKQNQVGYSIAYYYQFGVADTAGWPGGNGGWYYFSGTIDEPALYSRALDPSEIEAIYQAGAAGKCFSNSAPLIIQQPVGVTTDQSGSATFTVVATPREPLFYQWKFDGTNIANATDSTFSLTNVQPSNAGSYSVQVTNAVGSAESIDAVLVVPCSAILFFENFESGRLPPEMSVSTVGTFNSASGIQPLTNFGGSQAFGFGLSTCQDNCYGAHVTTLTISLPAPTYVSDLSFDEIELYGNWGSYGEVIIDGVWLSGTQDFGRVPINDGQADTTYRTHYFALNQVVTNISLEVTDITDVSEIFADNIALVAFSSNAPTILTQPESLTLSNGATAIFTVTGSSTVPISFQWSLDNTNLIGATNATLLVSNVSLAQAGDYQVSVANCSGLTQSQIAILTVAGTQMPPLITHEPVNVTTNRGADVAFYVVATGTSPLAYQWQFNSNNIPGATNVDLILTNVQLIQAGSYSVVVRNVVGVTNSADATLTVTLPHLYNTGVDDQSNPLPLEIPDPHYVLVSAPTGTMTTPFAPYTTENSGYPFGTYWLADDGESQWISPQPNYISGNESDSIGTYDYRTTFDLTASNAEAATVSFRIIADNQITDVLVNGRSAGLTFPPQLNLSTWLGPFEISNNLLQGPNTLDFIVSNLPPAGKGNVSGLRIEFSGASAPTIIQQPTGIVTNEGANAVFTVVAKGSPPLSYQWRSGLTNMPGQTNATLLLPDVLLSQSGPYSVFVSNTAGSTNSSDAFLMVYGPPVITMQPSNVITNQGAQASFTVVVATNLVSPSYQWFYDGSSISGQTNATLTLTNVQVSQDGSNWVVVSNPAGFVRSSNATLTVLQPVPPQISFVTPTSGSVFDTGTPITIDVKVTPGSDLVTNVSFYNHATLIGHASSSPYSFVWKNAPQGNASLTAIVSANDGLTGNSAAVSITVVTPTSPTTITLTSPANLTAYCVTDSIPLQASLSSNALAPTNVAFYYGSTNLLGSVSHSPYNFVWNNASPGTYSLTATAAFSDGSTITSSTATISVASQCGQGGLVAIVRNTDDSEIGLLRSNLFEIGFGSVVFDQSSLTVGELAGFILVVWEDLNGQNNQITDNTVTVLGQVYSNGIPLYFIGGGTLASDELALDQPQASQWSQLTSLTAATGKSGDGNVEMTQAIYQVLPSTYGVATNFSDATSFDSTTVTNADASVLAQSGTALVMVAVPGYVVPDPGLTRIITQNFEVGGGNDLDSLAQRHTLFLDNICWLTGCQACTFGGWGFNSAAPDYSPAGQPLTNSWSLINKRSCDYTGTTLTAVLPPGLEFVSAESSFGSWHYDNTNREVIFEVGLLPSVTNEDSQMTGSFTVIPEQPGMLTSTMTATINGQTPQQGQAITQVNGLTLSPASNDSVTLALLGIPYQNYDILTSTDLTNWTILTNVEGPNWSTSLQTFGLQLFFDLTTNQQSSP